MALFTLDLRPQSAGRGLPTQLLVTLVGDDEVVAVLAHEGCLLVCGWGGWMGGWMDVCPTVVGRLTSSWDEVEVVSEPTGGVGAST